jgi:LPXTG-site transpeptidase (sortase) family protein
MIRVIVTLLTLLVAGCGSATAPATHDEPSPTRSTPSPAGPSPRTPTSGSLLPAKVKVAEPSKVTISAIGVNADMVGVGLKPDGSMETPAYDSNEAGWYTEGPRPGETGPAVIAAHVDSKNGPDVFWRLRELSRGDKITVTDMAGVTYTFTVERLEQVDKDALPYKKIWADTDSPVLRLITCSGSYDQAAGEYRDNLIIYAKRQARS